MMRQRDWPTLDKGERHGSTSLATLRDGAGIVVYSDVVSPQTAVGYLTSIVGFGLYNFAKVWAPRGWTVSGKGEEGGGGGY